MPSGRSDSVYRPHVVEALFQDVVAVSFQDEVSSQDELSFQDGVLVLFAVSIESFAYLSSFSLDLPLSFFSSHPHLRRLDHRRHPRTLSPV